LSWNIEAIRHGLGFVRDVSTQQYGTLPYRALKASLQLGHEYDTTFSTSFPRVNGRADNATRRTATTDGP
jgi:hypothetical protein